MNPSASFLITLIALGLPALVFWPDRGLYAAVKRSRRLKAQALAETALKPPFAFEPEDRTPGLQSIAGAGSGRPDTAAGVPLTRLQPGERARVTRLEPGIQGAERRRLMDLGLLPGTAIVAELRSPSGDPTAYLVRGALLALRADQARHICVQLDD